MLSVVAFCMIRAVIGRKGRSSMCTWEEGNVNAYLGAGGNKSKSRGRGVILVNMEISVILGHEKTKIQNIID